MPEIAAPLAVSTSEARELSRVLLLRLRHTEQGTELHSYVRGTLIELNVSLVKFAARRFRSSHEPMDDIIQTGTVGLIKAIDRFDPDRGVELTTFALPTIIGEIRRFFRDSTWAVHVPRRLQEARLAVVRGSDELEQYLGRAPTTEELAVHLSPTGRGGRSARSCHRANRHLIGRTVGRRRCGQHLGVLPGLLRPGARRGGGRAVPEAADSRTA
ncbi:sigma-70 family RNA polymerase sigma factor [Kitasatospora azatica]|uniref:sigma-70 family RNA polymerase sigma factor n=1 Tax=Kitasatospora azatica TaxID=58347 RepID=UPI00068D5774|nr:sigma-70 family RNA polymerase sigma factor [Kitasatospora azatica]